MPNHIENRLEIRAAATVVEQIKNTFGTFHPSIPSTTYDDKLIIYKNGEGEVGWYNEESCMFSRRNEPEVRGVPDGFVMQMEDAWFQFPDFDKILAMPESVKRTFGEAGVSPRWYTWSIENWGTKWNSYECVQKDWNVFGFQTAWSSVPKLIIEMAKKFPDVEFVYEWSDEDIGYNCGEMELFDGRCLNHKIENASLEAFELAFKLRPDFRQYYKLVNGKYEYVES